jgi:hypothetical protein
MRAARFRALALLLLAACPAGADAPADRPGPPCTTGFIGDEGAATVVELTVQAMDGDARLVTDGDGVPLLLPPQGGRIIAAGVRARNLDGCAVLIQGYLRDPATQQVRLDARPVNLRVAADGWGESDAHDLASFANVPVCPNGWSPTAIDGNGYDLTITATDRRGNTASVTRHVVPACPAAAAECICQCKGGYKLGDGCPPGLGVTVR